jgi:hypothetical protein
VIFIRPSRAAITDSWFPRDDRRGAAILFWTPLLLPFVPGADQGHQPAVAVETSRAQSAARAWRSARRASSCRAPRCSASPPWWPR